MSAKRRRASIELDVIDRFRPRTDRKLVRSVVEAVLDHEDRRDLAVSLLLTGDEEIAELHGRFLDDPTETDVMSFETDGTADIVVNVARARREAKARGTTIRAEVALYIAHGLLHCCGHDDHEPDERAAMRVAESAVLAQLGLRHAQVDVDR